MFGNKAQGSRCDPFSSNFSTMSLQEIKEKLASLPRGAQDEVIAFLFHLRHLGDADYQASISQRMQDKESSHWVSPDEFERELGKRDGQ